MIRALLNVCEELIKLPQIGRPYHRLLGDDCRLGQIRTEEGGSTFEGTASWVLMQGRGRGLIIPWFPVPSPGGPTKPFHYRQLAATDLQGESGEPMSTPESTHFHCMKWGDSPIAMCLISIDGLASYGRCPPSMVNGYLPGIISNPNRRSDAISSPSHSIIASASGSSRAGPKR